MLQSIAVFSMRGRWQAAIAIALLSLGALVFPPLNYLASGVVVLTTLRMGAKEGMKVIVAATVILTLLAGLMLQKMFISALFLLTGWLPVYGISLVLGYSRSLAAAIMAAAGLGLLLVLGAYVLLPEPAAWWQQAIAPYLTQISEQPGWQFSQAQTQALLESVSAMMTAIMAAGMTFNVILGLLIGRAWQASLYNPGGFADEFMQIRLGKTAAMVTVVLMVVSLTPFSQSLAVLRDSLPVMLIIFAFQGLAVVHTVVKQRQKHKFWLIAMYVLLVIAMPQMVVLLATLGIWEQWFNFRRRSSERGG